MSKIIPINTIESQQKPTIPSTQQVEDMRPEGYQYLEIIKDHIDKYSPKKESNFYDKVFDGSLIYPRQLEIHLPGSGKNRCNFDCDYCQGNELDMSLGPWETKVLTLLEKLKGKIPYHVYGGAYTEPLMNKYFMDYIRMTKKYKNNFGIHSNGSLLFDLENKKGLVTELVSLADSELDYFSCSLDAGSIESHKKVKNVKVDYFTKIIDGLELMVKARGENSYPKIRVVYLITEQSDSPEEIEYISKKMREIGVDSLRFSIPYANYGRSFDEVKKYRDEFEIPFGKKCFNMVQKYLSKDKKDKTYIFWHDPEFQSVDKMNFKQCIYSYYQITFGADGSVYKCSSTATPSFDKNILGEATDDLDVFNKMVLDNHDPDWDASTCFNAGARCNRIALEINKAWEQKIIAK
jgi:MoaA/NifB/PqqE/SkfB family radical SAM enzyme